MSQKRRIQRKLAQRAKKAGKVKTKKALQELAAMPDKCSSCSAPFEIKNDFHLDNWLIKVTDAGIEMLCHTCKAGD